MSDPQPQPSSAPYYPPPTPIQSHGHGLYKVTIAVLLIIIVVSSSVATYGYLSRTSELNSQIQRTSTLTDQNKNLQDQANQLKTQVSNLQFQIDQLKAQLSTRPTIQLIWLSGKLDISPNSGTPLWIFFDNQDTGTLSSAAFGDHSYQLWIQIDKTYTVRIYYETLVAYDFCSARPGIFTPNENTVTQNFRC